MDIRKWLSNKKAASSGSSKDIVEAELPERDLVQSELTPPAREDVPAAAGAPCSTISTRMGQQPPPAPPFNATAPDDLGTEGPAQVILQSYPVRIINSQKRTFTKNRFNGRKWLEYSVVADAAFCFPCRTFNIGCSANARDGVLESWTRTRVGLECRFSGLVT